MQLKEAAADLPKYYILYEITKYCKIPLLENIDDSDKHYIPLKPKDVIKILWEDSRLINPTPKYLSILNENGDERRYYFTWTAFKVSRWVETTTNKK